MENNRNKRHHIRNGMCVICGGVQLLLVNRSEVKLRCEHCGYVFAVVKLIDTENGARPFLREVEGRPPFFVGA